MYTDGNFDNLAARLPVSRLAKLINLGITLSLIIYIPVFFLFGNESIKELW